MCIIVLWFTFFFFFFNFKLDPSIFESLQKERVEAGDVIYIEANSGAVKVMLWFVCHEETQFPGDQGNRVSGMMLTEGQ